jgi:hypothetical protein
MIWILARGALFFGQEFVSVLPPVRIHRSQGREKSISPKGRKITNVFFPLAEYMHAICDLNAAGLLL